MNIAGRTFTERKRKQMIIDDEYCQYEMWRIVNKAETDAIKHFKEELLEAKAAQDVSAAKEEFLKCWSLKADEAARQAAGEEESEESVYNTNYSGKMKALWEAEV